MPELCTIYDYMRAHASFLGERILQEYPALHQFDDPVSPRIQELLRKPFPAQTIAIMGTAKRWQQARTAMVVAECGTGKTLISLDHHFRRFDQSCHAIALLGLELHELRSYRGAPLVRNRNIEISAWATLQRESPKAR